MAPRTEERDRFVCDRRVKQVRASPSQTIHDINNSIPHSLDLWLSGDSVQSHDLATLGNGALYRFDKDVSTRAESRLLKRLNQMAENSAAASRSRRASTGPPEVASSCCSISTSPALAGLGREERTKVDARSAAGEGASRRSAPCR